MGFRRYDEFDVDDAAGEQIGNVLHACVKMMVE